MPSANSKLKTQHSKLADAAAAAASPHKYGESVRVWSVMDYFHPGAEAIARALAKAPVSPEAVVIAGTLIGIAGGALVGAGWLKIGAALLLLKNILDKADGSLARLKGKTSRFGRFLDSLGDFAVSLATFAGIAHYLAPRYGNAAWFHALAAWAFLSSLLQCTYYVYYQVSFIRKVLQRETVNRETEFFTGADRRAPLSTRVLQRTYIVIYGWQDALAASLDRFLLRRWKRGREGEPDAEAHWYGDAWRLRLGSFLGLGAHIAAATLACAFDRLEWYLLWAAAGAWVWLAGVVVAKAGRKKF